MTNEPTHIELAPDDAAFIVRGDGSPELLIPKGDPDAEVAPDSPTWRTTVLALVFSDHKLFDLVSAKILEDNEANEDDESEK
jgi:hypothetical protein